MAVLLTWNDNNYASNLFDLRRGAYYAIPKPKFLYYVDFRISAFGRKRLSSLNENRKLGFIVKNMDRPTVQYQQQELNQYNRKRTVTTGVSYGSVTFTLHDTVDETALKLFKDYSEYYYHDFNTGPEAWSYDVIPATSHTNNAGVAPRSSGSDIYFFQSIDVYEFYNSNYTKYSLMNPKFESVNFSSNDMQSSEGNEISFTIKPEGVVYEAISAEMTQEIADMVGLPFRTGSTGNFRFEPDDRVPGQPLGQTSDSPNFQLPNIGNFVGQTIGNIATNFVGNVVGQVATNTVNNFLTNNGLSFLQPVGNSLVRTGTQILGNAISRLF